MLNTLRRLWERLPLGTAGPQRPAGDPDDRVPVGDRQDRLHVQGVRGGRDLRHLGRPYDAFVVASLAPAVVESLISNSLNAALIPTYIRGPGQRGAAGRGSPLHDHPLAEHHAADEPLRPHRRHGEALASPPRLRLFAGEAGPGDPAGLLDDAHRPGIGPGHHVGGGAERPRAVRRRGPGPGPADPDHPAGPGPGGTLDGHRLHGGSGTLLGAALNAGVIAWSLVKHRHPILPRWPRHDRAREEGRKPVRRHHRRRVPDHVHGAGGPGHGLQAGPPGATVPSATG